MGAGCNNGFMPRPQELEWQLRERGLHQNLGDREQPDASESEPQLQLLHPLILLVILTKDKILQSLALDESFRVYLMFEL